MTDCRLMLHFNGTDGDTSTVDATGRHPTITFHGTAQIDTAVKKFGTGSLLVDGDSDCLSIPNSEDWNICAVASENWTIDFWVKFTDHVGDETLVGQYQDADNLWKIQHLHGSGIRFLVKHLGAFPLLSGWGAEIEDSLWHHVALCRVANEYGLYIDGEQVVYHLDSDLATFAGSLYISAQGNPSYYFDGSIDELRIDKSNHFGAAPNVGLTDTIVVPTDEYEAYELLPEFPTLSTSPNGESWTEQDDAEAVEHSKYYSGYPLANSQVTFDGKDFRHTMLYVSQADKESVETFYRANKSRNFLWLNDSDSLKYQMQFRGPPRFSGMSSDTPWRVEIDLRQVNSQTVS